MITLDDGTSFDFPYYKTKLSNVPSKVKITSVSAEDARKILDWSDAGKAFVALIQENATKTPTKGKKEEEKKEEKKKEVEKKEEEKKVEKKEEKKKTKKLHPSYKIMILRALNDMSGPNKYISTEAIRKYIVAHYELGYERKETHYHNNTKLKLYVNKTLPKLIEQDLIIKNKPTGRSYRITEEGKNMLPKKKK